MRVVIDTNKHVPIDVDDMFLEAAIAAEAKQIVTGDKKLLELNGYGNISIISPAAFLKSI